MRVARQTKLLVEPPSVATGDIAFNLIVFFLVCASVTPDTGRKQDIPRAEPKKEEKEQTKPTEVRLTRASVILNGSPVGLDLFEARLTAALQEKAGSPKPVRELPDSARIVVVSTKDNKDTPYHHWVAVTSLIEKVGGIVTLQMEDERTVTTD